MRVEDLLSLRLNLKTINSDRIRYELEARVDLAKTLLGIEFLPEVISAFEQANMSALRPEVTDVFFVDMPVPNAFAFTDRGKPSVALCAGLPFLTRTLLWAAIAERSTFSGIADVHYLRESYHPEGHCDWSGLTKLINSFSMNGMFSCWKSLPRLEMNDSQSGRGDLAIILSLQADAFFLCHELGHCAMRHLAHSQKAEGVSQAYAEVETAIPAFSSIADMSEPQLLRHAYELEADRYAIAKMFNGFFRQHSRLSPVRLNNWRPNYVMMTKIGERSRGRLWIVTIGLIFLMFEVACRNAKSGSHPPPLFRLRHLIEWTRVQLRGEVNLLDDFDLGCAEAIEDLTLIANNLGIGAAFRTGIENDLYSERMKTARHELGSSLTSGI